MLYKKKTPGGRRGFPNPPLTGRRFRGHTPDSGAKARKLKGMIAKAAEPDHSPRQRSLPLPDPAAHHEAVHTGQRAVSLLWQPGHKRKWTKVRPGEPLPELLPLNLFETPNEFAGWVLARHLRWFRAVWVELDAPHTPHHQLLEGAAATCDDRGWPWPSLAVLSRNGLHLYWLLTPTPAEALPRWQAVQRRLHEAFQDLGSDPAGQKVTQVLRMAGTKHTKPERGQHQPHPVEGYWLAGPQPHAFSSLADRILPYAQAEIRDMQAAQARRGKGQGPARKGTIYEWWARVYQDLIAICDYHWFGGVPEGYRDRVLFLLANALSWFTHPEALRSEIERTARTWTPSLTAQEARAYTAPIVRRALHAAAGRRYEWNGQLWDPRYHFRRHTLRQWLDGLIPEELEPQLSGLASDAVLAERRRERDQQRKRAERGDKAAQRAERAVQARTMAEAGHSQRQIAAALGVSVGTINNWLRNGRGE